jgi:hypothetical protein
MILGRRPWVITVNDLMRAVGRKGYLQVHGLEIKVVILDVRQVFSRVDYLVEPEAGLGSSWVAANTIRIIDPGSGGRRVIL